MIIINNLLKKQNEKGFTLIEVLVVVAIVGILSAILFINNVKFTESAKNNVIKSEARDIYTYYATYTHEKPSASDEEIKDYLYSKSNKIKKSSIEIDSTGIKYIVVDYGKEYNVEIKNDEIKVILKK